MAAVRKVRTSDGAKFYGLPIGSPIAADVVDLKHKQASALGKTAPKNALSPASKSPISTVKVKPSTLTGTATATVGKSTYNVPSGSKVIRLKKNSGVAYVSTPDGEIHSLNEQGMVTISPVLVPILKEKFPPDFEGDDDYSVEDAVEADQPEADAAPAEKAATVPSVSAAEAPVGSVVIDDEGTALFTKQESGWANEAFGLTVTDEDVQGFVNSGTLKISPAPSAEDDDSTDAPEDSPAALPEVGSTPLADLDDTAASDLLNGLPDGTTFAFTFAPVKMPMIVKDPEQGWSNPSGIEVDESALIGLKKNLEIFGFEGTITHLKSTPVDAPVDAPAPAPKVDAPAPAPKVDAPAPAPKVEEKAPAPKVAEKPYTHPYIEAQLEGISPAARAKIEKAPIHFNTVFFVLDDTVWEQDTQNGTIAEIDEDGFDHNLASAPPEMVDPAIDPTSKVKVIKHHPDALKNKPFGFPKSVSFSKDTGTFAFFGFVNTKKKMNGHWYSRREDGLWQPFSDGSSLDYNGLELGKPVTLEHIQDQAKANKSTAYVWDAFTGEKVNASTYSESAEVVAPKVAEKPKAQPKTATAPKVEEKPSAQPKTAKSPFAKTQDTPAEDKAPKVYALGDTVEKYGHLREMPDGSKVLVKFSSTSNGVIIVKKDGQWFDVFNTKVSPGDLADSIINDEISFVSSPAAPTQDDDLDVQLVPGGAILSKKQVAEAIAAMEAHSGFQIAYGYKSIPDHPLAQKDFQDQVKGEAQKFFPDLKPKQAFVAYLKTKSGVAPAAEEKKVKAVDPNAPKISLGSTTPKSTGVQGYDGGEFTVEDVAEAIEILEAFKGKAFKAELNKHGNALGTLNPNALVGFDKDKQVVKQNFLAVLKQKHAAHGKAPTQATAADAGKPLLIADLDALPIGSSVRNEDNVTYTKTTASVWTGEDNVGSFKTSSLHLDGTVTLVSKPAPVDDTPEYAKTAPALAQAQAAALDYDVPSLPVGTVVKNTNYTFTKKSDDQWVSQDGYDFSDDVLVHVLGKAGVTLTTPEDSDTSEGTPPASDLPIGTKVGNVGTYGTLTKIGESLWSSPDGANFSDFFVQTYGLDEGSAVVTPNAVVTPKENKNSEPVNLLDMAAKDMPVFSVVVTKGDISWAKSGENDWFTADGTHVGDAEIQHMIKKGLIKDGASVEAPKTPDAPAPEKNSKDAPLPITGTMLTFVNVPGLPVGSTMTSKTSGGNLYVWTKQPDGQWFAPELALYRTDVHMANRIQNGSVVSVQPAAQADNDFKKAHPSTLATGSTATFTADVVWTKKADGNWVSSKTPHTVITSNLMAKKFQSSDLIAVQPAVADLPPLTGDDIKKTHPSTLAAGSTATLSTGTVWTKQEDGTWTASKPSLAPMSETVMATRFQQSAIVSVQPAHPKKGAGKKDKSEGLPEWDGKDAHTAPVGSRVVYNASTLYTKNSDGEWDAFYLDSGKPKNYVRSSNWIQQGVGQGSVVKYVEPTADAPLTPDAPKHHGLAPGKYSTGTHGTAYMVVFADKGGVYVSSKGVTPIDDDKVKSNWAAGMDKYQGLVPDASVPKATLPPVKKKKKILGPVTLQDGTYYLGASKDLSSAVYVVQGDTVTITKDYETETHPLSKIKAAFFLGKIVDESGNSVLPEGHSGSVVFQNIPTTVQGLANLKKALDDGTITAPFYQTDEMSKIGVSLHSGVLYRMVKGDVPESVNFGYVGSSSHNPNTDWNKHSVPVLKAHLDAFLKSSGVDLTVPEVSTADLFEWGVYGMAIKPDVPSAVHVYSLSAPEITAMAKTISEHFDGGNLFSIPTAKTDKVYWINAFHDGDFAKMYAYEVSSLSAKGKSHPNGFKHPGYSGNAATNKVVWGPSVAGETPPGTTIPGTWSSVEVSQWSPAELDNYLIAANMQNPEYLDIATKRKWVHAHKTSQMQVTNEYSAQAAAAKKAGLPAKTLTPAWTDNIVPATVYDYMFDGTPVPDKSNWNGAPQTVSLAWAVDNWSDPEFRTFLVAEGVTQDAYTESMKQDYYIRARIGDAVANYWGSKNDAYLAELAKPKYSLVKKITGPDAGTHDVWITTDQFDRKYVFKPINSPSNLFRAEIEKASADLANLWGFSTPKHSVVEIDGQTGLLQDFAPHTSSFQQVDMVSLSPKQLGQVASEHVLDWAIDNDDTHASNLLLGTNGSVVGIDKGRGFRVFGAWNGLSGDSSAHSNANLAYTKLYDGIRNGTISEEQASAAYFAARKAALRIQRSDDSLAESMLRDGVKNRTKWAPPGYMPPGTKAPKDADELVAAFLDRKSHLVDDVDAMWGKIFSSSPYQMPEPPAKALGDDHFSGWGESGLIETVDATKSWGTSTLHASPSISAGSSLLWSEKADKGDDIHRGTLAVGAFAQKKILDHFKTKVSAGPTSMNVEGFPNLGPWKSVTSAAAKDASKHAADKEYIEEKWTALQDLVQKIAKDKSHWDSAMATAGATPEAGQFAQFPSGVSVPQTGLLQYKMALDHYEGLAQKALQARIDGTTTQKTDFTVYTAVAISPKSPSYSGPDGASLTPLADGTFLKKDSNGDLSVLHSGDATAMAKTPGWAADAKAAPPVDPIMYTFANAKGFGGTLQDDGSKVATGHIVGAGQGGNEYTAVLPTGEIISFRNASSTSTYKSQQGRISFTLAGAEPEASLERIQTALANMGLDTAGADETDAETVYWRQSFQRVMLSKGGSTKVQAARAQITGMFSELNAALPQGSPSVDQFNVVEAIGVTRTPEEEREFWKDLAVQTWGAEKVQKWISSGSHLPQYNHQDLSDTTKQTGFAHFNRIDVDVDALHETGSFLAIGNNGKDDALLRYLKTGGMLSTEERLRVLGFFKNGASSTSDQGTGGASSVFTRIAQDGGALKSGAIYGSHVAYWSPTVLAQTGTYSFGSDQYGNTSNQPSENHYNPLSSISNHLGSGNETMVQGALSIYDHLEIAVFENSAKRNEAIQRMKALGIEKLRGLPIEDRFVMRSKLDDAIKKVRAAWKK